MLDDMGFEADTCRGEVKLEERKVEKGLRPREEIFEATPGPELPARTMLATASLLNTLHWVAPGGFCHLRSGRDAVAPVEVRREAGHSPCICDRAVKK